MVVQKGRWPLGSSHGNSSIKDPMSPAWHILVDADAGVDVVFSTVALPAFYSAIPASVGMRDQDFDLMGEVCERVHTLRARRNMLAT